MALCCEWRTFSAPGATLHEYSQKLYCLPSYKIEDRPLKSPHTLSSVDCIVDVCAWTKFLGSARLYEPRSRPGLPSSRLPPVNAECLVLSNRKTRLSSPDFYHIILLSHTIMNLSTNGAPVPSCKDRLLFRSKAMNLMVSIVSPDDYRRTKTLTLCILQAEKGCWESCVVAVCPPLRTNRRRHSVLDRQSTGAEDLQDRS